MKNYKKLSILFILFLFFVFFGCKINKTDLYSSFPVYQVWYTFDDDPLKNNFVNWNSVDREKPLKMEEGKDIYWLRLRFPDLVLRDPVMFIHDVFEYFEVYLDGHKVYSFQDPDTRKHTKTMDILSHKISLPKDFAGKDIIIKVYNDYTKSKFPVRIEIGENARLLVFYIKKDFDNLFFGVFFLFCFVFCLILFALMQQNKQYLYFSFMCLTLGLLTLTRTTVKDLISPNQFAWSYIHFFTILVFPYGYMLMSRRVLGKGYFNINVWLIFFNLAVSLFLILLVLFNIISASYIVPIQYLLLALIFVIILPQSIIKAFKTDFYSLVLSLSTLILVVFGFIDFYRVRMQMGTDYILHWGFLIIIFLTSIAIVIKFWKNYTISIKDDLTGLYNKYYFESLYEVEWKRCSRTTSPLSVIKIEIDFIKKYYEIYGHSKGDHVQIETSNIFLDIVKRPGDFISRIGEGRFIVVLPHTDIQGAVKIAESLRKDVLHRNIRFKENENIGVVSLSLGVSSGVPDLNSDKQSILQKADYALHRAKKEGHNQFFMKL